MKPLIHFWHRLNFEFDRNLESALCQQHLAAQFVALLGRYLVPKKPDSSNINMQYNVEQKTLLGHFFETDLQLALHLPSLEICLLKNGKELIKKIQLNGKTFEQVFGELRLALISLSIDIFPLKKEQPYSLSTNFLTDNRFSTKDVEALNSATVLRHNAEIIISEIAKGLKDAEPVRIWPHHFDTGTFFTRARNNSGAASQTIGLGWAMPDEMINEPYFYLSFWTENEVKFNGKLNSLKEGKWMIPKWKGAVLKHSEIVNEKSAKGQHQLVKQFFNEGVSILNHFLKKQLI
jgi:hypothetical protein